MNIEHVPYWHLFGSNMEELEHIRLSGEIYNDDVQRFRSMLKIHCDANHVVIADSPGGNYCAGLLLAGAIYESGKPVSLHGPLYSAASVLALSGSSTISFYDAEWSVGAFETEIFLHGTYEIGSNRLDRVGTAHIAMVLESLCDVGTHDEWYRLLMEKTSPTKFVKFLVSDLVVRGEKWRTRGVQHIDRRVTGAVGQLPLPIPRV